MARGAESGGGGVVPVAGDDTPVARAIALAFAHPLGVGNAYFRIGVAGPRWVDTVPFGCFRREGFERGGMFDEELVRNPDDQFNPPPIRPRRAPLPFAPPLSPAPPPPP